MSREFKATAGVAVRADPIILSRADPIEQAAASIFDATLDHFAANVAAFRVGEDPETIHQMRVALRRLRAALGLFRPVLSGPALAEAGHRARALAIILGVARDHDVFIEMIDAGPLSTFPPGSDAGRLRTAARNRRAEGYAAVRRMIADGATDDFQADFRQIIKARDWLAAPEAVVAGSAPAFAATALTRARRRVLRRSKDLAAQTQESRHAVRIALKKARYAAEFFESLFGRRKAARAWSKALAALQDSLGAFNDLATADRLLDGLDADDPSLARVSGFVRGWFAHAAMEGDAHMHHTERTLKALAPFWA
jgi:CHAD domain-containing protein